MAADREAAAVARLRPARTLAPLIATVFLGFLTRGVRYDDNI